jgi:pseudaminic acid synthase
MNLKKYLQENRTYVIAEMSANHAKDLSVALQIVDAAKSAGADCLKTQTYTADTLTINSSKESFRISEGLWNGKTVYDLYSNAYMPWEWNATIYDRCKALGIDYLSTAFDTTSVDYLIELGVEAIKIASFEIVDIPLVTYAASKGKTMILSCGMCSRGEIHDAVKACYSVGNKDVILMKCSSEYPANVNNLNLNTIPDMIQTFGLPTGFSDHSLGSASAVVATCLGASIIEKHFCLDKEIQTPDCEFSMDPLEFRKMVCEIRTAEIARGHVYYGLSSTEQESLVFRRSLYAIKDITVGECFSKENIRSIRPGYGIAPKYLNRLLGKTSARIIEKGEPIQWIDLEGES